MNYYEHHIGDYDEATAHLTACEDGIYSRLIRKYMGTEKPLAGDLKALQRLVRARTREEKEAVETVLEEFFEQREDGWHQHRCDETIARYQDKQAKARRSAEARWGAHRTQSDGNANAYADEMRTHCEGNAHQAPDTKHQSPNTNQNPSGTASALGITPRDGAATASALSAAMRRHQISAQPADPRIIAAAAAGITPETVEAACAEAKSVKPGERISAGYVIAIAERWTAEAAKPKTTASGSPRRQTSQDARLAQSAANVASWLEDSPADDNRTIDMPTA